MTYKIKDDGGCLCFNQCVCGKRRVGFSCDEDEPVSDPSLLNSVNVTVVNPKPITPFKRKKMRSLFETQPVENKQFEQWLTAIMKMFDENGIVYDDDIESIEDLKEWWDNTKEEKQKNMTNKAKKILEALDADEVEAIYEFVHSGKPL